MAEDLIDRIVTADVFVKREEGLAVAESGAVDTAGGSLDGGTLLEFPHQREDC